MSLLFRNALIHQVFGANTEVGKTVFTTALVQAAIEKRRRVLYLKPVSTGPVEEEDDR
jgi:bifunctional dethiobiotin synthetase / adenosylmethionine---8-amino-7-oxononanoate aminotransferase